MITIKRVLHPTDFSQGAAAAFDHALHLARHFEAELHLLHVVPALSENPIAEAYEAAASGDAYVEAQWEKADARLNALVKAHPDRHVTLRRVLSRGPDAAPVILEYAEAEGIDVIVMGTSGRRGLRHLLLGSVTEEVVHAAACHVMTVRKREEVEPRPVQRILAPVDFSDYSLKALQTAIELAGSFGAEVYALHVIQPLPFSVSLATTLSLHELLPGIVKKTRAHLGEIVDSVARPDVPVQVDVLEGEPTRTIMNQAEGLGIDMIVMAPRGMTGFERFILGSVAEYIVRHAACPVFVARTPTAHRKGEEAEEEAEAATL